MTVGIHDVTKSFSKGDIFVSAVLRPARNQFCAFLRGRVNETARQRPPSYETSPAESIAAGVVKKKRNTTMGMLKAMARTVV